MKVWYFLSSKPSNSASMTMGAPSGSSRSQVRWLSIENVERRFDLRYVWSIPRNAVHGPVASSKATR